MPKVKFDGLGKSKGEVQTGFDPWKAGDYLLECISVTWGETRVQKLPQLEVKTTIVDVDAENESLLEDQEPIGKPFVFWLSMNPDKQFTLDVLKGLLNAANVRVTNDEFDEQKLVGKQFWGSLTVEAGQVVNGTKQRDRNRCIVFTKAE